MTWIQDLDLDSKAMLRTRCRQKLEDMIQQLKVWCTGTRWATHGESLTSRNLLEVLRDGQVGLQECLLRLCVSTIPQSEYLWGILLPQKDAART